MITCKNKEKIETKQKKQERQHKNKTVQSFAVDFRANDITSVTNISFTLVYIGFFPVQIDGKKVSSIKDLIEEAQPEEEELNKQQEVAEKLKAFLMVGVH